MNLNVGVDTGKAKKDVVSLAKSIIDTFKGTDKSIQSSTSSMQSLENRIQKTSDKLSALRDRQAELAQKQIPTQEYVEIQKQIEQATKQLDKYNAMMDKASETGNRMSTRQTRNIQYEVAQLESTVEYAKAELQDLVDTGRAFTLGGDSAEYARVSQQIRYAEDEMSLLNTKHDEMIAKQEQEISGAERLKSAFNGVRNSVSKVVSGVKSMASAGKRSFNDIEKSTTRSLKNLLKYALGIRSLYVLFRRLRTTATESLKAMGKQFPEIQSDLNALSNSFNGLKASIGTMFQPLLAAAVPVLTTIINLATRAANAIGSLFAALTGQDYVYKATAANNDYADSVSGVGKAAKEANKQLGEYDELMVIQQDTNTGGAGGGGGGADSGMNWEKVPVESSIQDLADRIKKAWEDADFFDIGYDIGTKIKNGLDGIDWASIQETAYKIGKSLATLLNGIFASDVLDSVGDTVGNALNTAIQLGLGFVENFDWAENGKKIASGLNHLLDTFDEHAFAELITKAIKGALDLATGFFSEADFKLLGEKLGNLISDLTMEIPEITVKITKLAWEIAKDAAGFVAGLNESNPFLVDLLGVLGIIKLAGAGFGFTMPLLTIAVAKIGWDLGNTIYESLDTDENGQNLIDRFVEASGLGDLAVTIADLFEDLGGLSIDGFIQGLVDALTEFELKLKAWVDTYIIEPWKELLGIHSPSTVFAEFGKMCIEGLKNGLLNEIANIKQWIQTNVIAKITGAFEGMKEIAINIKAAFSDTKDSIKAKWSDIISGVQDKTAYMRAAIATKWNDIKDAWNGVVGNIQNKTASMKASFVTKWNDIKNDYYAVYNNVVGKTISLSASFTAKWSNFKKTYQNFIANFKNKSFTISATFSAAASDLKKWVNTNVIAKINTQFYKVPILKSHPIPYLAKGAVIPPNKEFMAILGDQKQGTNIETPLATMVEAFTRALDMRDENASNKEPIVLQLDGKDVATAVWDEEEKRYKQTGKYRPSYS